jgi:hypothetical protein
VPDRYEKKAQRYLAMSFASSDPATARLLRSLAAKTLGMQKAALIEQQRKE